MSWESRQPQPAGLPASEGLRAGNGSCRVLMRSNHFGAGNLIKMVFRSGAPCDNPAGRCGGVQYEPGPCPYKLAGGGFPVGYPEWVIDRNNAGPLPDSPVQIPPPDPRYTSSRPRPEEDIILIPFGAARLRISVFPCAAP
jgi:hypothetical protein